MHARLLQRARPADVAPLVEAGLQLHQADRLLALFRCLDQPGDQRRVVGRAVHGHLDREHVGVLDRLLDEALDAGGERLVGVVHQDVALAHRGENVGLVLLRVAEGGRGDRGPRLVAQVAVAVEPVDLPQVGEVEQPVDVDHLVLLEVQRVDQQLAQAGVHARLHLEADDLAEAALAQLVLDRPQQVVGLVGDREVGVAGHPEDAVLEDLHAGEQVGQVLARSPTPAARRCRCRWAGSAAAPPWEPSRARRSPARTPGRAARRRGSARGWRCRGRGARARRRAASAPGRPARGRSPRSPRLRPRCSPGSRRCGCRPRRGRAGCSCSNCALWRSYWPASPLGHAVDGLRGGEAVGLAGVDPGVHLVVEAGDAHHHELVEVRRSRSRGT